MAQENGAAEALHPGEDAFSLLWPDGVERQAVSIELDAHARSDLVAEEFVYGLIADKRWRMEMGKDFFRLCQSPEVIAYRQEIMDDLLGCPGPMELAEAAAEEMSMEASS